MSKNLNEANCPRKPITALRRCEAELTLLHSQMRNLVQLVTDFAKSVSEVRGELDALSDRVDRELSTPSPRQQGEGPQTETKHLNLDRDDFLPDLVR